MKKILTKPMLGFLFMVLLGLYSVAQEKKEEKDQISIRITREEDGDIKTLEKTYSSEKELKTDPELREFMGEEDKVSFWFSDEISPGLENFDLDKSRFMFSFDGHEVFTDRMRHLPDSLFEEFDKIMQERMKDMHKNDVTTFRFGFDEDCFALPDSAMRYMAFRSPRHENSNTHFENIVIKRIRISEEIGDDFGKKGQVKPSDKLELDGLRYYPNPSPNGRFKLKFQTPIEGELSIKIYNLDGKEIFNRYFETYNGLYSEAIDLSGQEVGVYLLEVALDGKRLTRKIAIH